MSILAALDARGLAMRGVTPLLRARLRSSLTTCIPCLAICLDISGRFKFAEWSLWNASRILAEEPHHLAMFNVAVWAENLTH